MGFIRQECFAPLAVKKKKIEAMQARTKTLDFKKLRVKRSKIKGIKKRKEIEIKKIKKLKVKRIKIKRIKVKSSTRTKRTKKIKNAHYGKGGCFGKLQSVVNVVSHYRSSTYHRYDMAYKSYRKIKVTDWKVLSP